MSHRRPAWAWALGIALALILWPWPGHAAEVPPLTPQVSITFGETVTIVLPLNSLGPVRRVEIYLRPEGQIDTYTQDMILEENQARYDHPVAKKPLPLFGRVYYWFKIYPAQGPVYRSPAFMFIYEDNRFAWQARTVEPVTVHWYQGDAALAEEALNAAHIALKNAFVQWQGRLNPERGVRVYIYASAKDLYSALSTLPPDMRDDAIQWAQHTVLVYGDPSPSSRTRLQHQIAYQVAHIVLYDTAGNGFSLLPWWFREGLAALAEPQPAPTALKILYDAAAANQLFPLRDLCFPPDFESPEDETLARAEARAFVTYLFTRYGPAGLQRLLEMYTRGLGCEEGVRAALGVALTDLEHNWRAAQELIPQPRVGLGWVGLWVALGILAPSAVLGAWHWRTRHALEEEGR